MTVVDGPAPSSPDDRSFAQAAKDAQRDYARLFHIHQVDSWSLDLQGTLRWTCSCSPGQPRNTAALESHILEAVRKARGPIRGYKGK